MAHFHLPAAPALTPNPGAAQEAMTGPAEQDATSWSLLARLQSLERLFNVEYCAQCEGHYRMEQQQKPTPAAFPTPPDL